MTEILRNEKLNFEHKKNQKNVTNDEEINKLEADKKPENVNKEENGNNKLKFHVYEKWDEYNLKDDLLRGLYAMGFDTPSYIQKTAVMPIISGFDVRAQAQSGTGKTGAFAVAALQRLNTTEKSLLPQVMVVVNTLEVAKQNYDRIIDFGQFMEFKIALLVAGVHAEQNVAELRKGVDIIVGTPGRINHMIRDGHLNCKGIRLFIVDEADEMLKYEFQDQMKDIFRAFNSTCLQSAFFSATWEPESIKVASHILQNPVTIDLRQDDLTLKGIEQYYVNIGARPTDKDTADAYKIACLETILTSRSIGQCIVFVQSKKKTTTVYERIKDAVGFPVALITGDLSPRERTDALNGVRDGTVRVLISTAVTARGIDIQQLSVVINLDIPRVEDKSSYIHRIGRAGRYGRKGKAINIIFSDELSIIEDLMNHYHTNMEPMPSDLEL